MSGFQTEHAYFDFAHAVRGAYRHLIDQEASEFIAEVRRSSQRRWMKLPIGFLMWRAQLGIRGCSWGFDEDGPYLENSPHPPQRMKPLLHGAREGRANPKGVPVLYLASDKDTAVAEIRPWTGAYVSVGEFATTRQVVVVDCSNAHSHWWPSEKLSVEELEEASWGHINDAFSRPITPSDDQADYIATQLLVEAFRREGFDGVIFRSSCGPGKCFALFNVADADLCKCEVRLVGKIMFPHALRNRSYDLD